MKQMSFSNSLAFSMIHRMVAIWSLVPLPFLNLAWTSGSSQFTYSWSLAWRILSTTFLASSEMSATVWSFKPSLVLPLGLEWKLTFSSPVATAEFSKFAGILNNYKSIFHWLSQVPFFLNQQAKELQVHLVHVGPDFAEMSPGRPISSKCFFLLLLLTLLLEKRFQKSDTNMQHRSKSPKPGDTDVGRQSLFTPVLLQ